MKRKIQPTWQHTLSRISWTEISSLSSHPLLSPSFYLYTARALRLSFWSRHLCVLGLLRQAHSTQQQALISQHQKCVKATVWVGLMIASKAIFWITTEPPNKQIQFQHNKFKTNVNVFEQKIQHIHVDIECPIPIQLDMVLTENTVESLS